MSSYDRLFIGGEWAPPSSAAAIEVRNASTCEVIGSVPEAAEADVDAAVAAARRAFDDPAGWSSWSNTERAAALERLATELEARAQEIGRLVSMQNGMPIALSPVIEGMTPVGTLRYMASEYTDEDDAIRIANESDYGLGGSVWTSDSARARSVIRRVRTGTMGINGYLPDPAGPWGGVKSSGLGRELGPGAIAAYQNLKTVYA
jgi:acyl-CoA reductase-like NAD-dependent aldehyde dehydrogenase